MRYARLLVHHPNDQPGQRATEFENRSSEEDAEALGFIEEPNSFNLVLLCQSVPEESRVSLVSLIKELDSKLPVFMLYNGHEPTAAKVDGSLHNLESPEVWLDMINFLIQKPAPESSAA